jgi:hypothetical protein
MQSRQRSSPLRAGGCWRAGGWPGRCLVQRQKLGWIAVSGEDDRPHRPVNVPSTEFQQYDLAVDVKGIRVNTRYMIAERQRLGALACASPTRRVPVDPAPSLAPEAKVILLVHGMDSRLEEALDLTKALHKIAETTRENWTVISMDLPTSGYADNIDHRRISPLGELGEAKFRFHGATDLELTDLQVFNARGQHKVPLLDFIEDFILAFVDKLEKSIPGVSTKLKAVVGGSLGGNMAMCIGRRVGAPPWIRNVVPWSPAAIWPSFADGANPADPIAVAIPFMWAGGDPRQLVEEGFMRRLFFHLGFDWKMGVLGRPAQAKEWYRKEWDCTPSHGIAARLDRHETYDSNFRLWHWRLGAEQLLFSQQGPPGSIPRCQQSPSRTPLYCDNTKRMLLLCG